MNTTWIIAAAYAAPGVALFGRMAIDRGSYPPKPPNASVLGWRLLCVGLMVSVGSLWPIALGLELNGNKQER